MRHWGSSLQRAGAENRRGITLPECCPFPELSSLSDSARPPRGVLRGACRHRQPGEAVSQAGSEPPSAEHGRWLKVGHGGSGDLEQKLIYASSL